MRYTVSSAKQYVVAQAAMSIRRIAGFLYVRPRVFTIRLQIGRRCNDRTCKNVGMDSLVLGMSKGKGEVPFRAVPLWDEIR
jgi:hypothetical protein